MNERMKQYKQRRTWKNDQVRRDFQVNKMIMKNELQRLTNLAICRI